jgi:predicted nucleic acid-binding protein
MLVVADASPLNVLIRIELIDVLERLFGRVVFSISDELLDGALRRAERPSQRPRKNAPGV